MSDFIEERMTQEHIPGIAICLVDDQRMVWSRGFGFTDMGKGIPATEESLFEIGSVSKIIAVRVIFYKAI